MKNKSKTTIYSSKEFLSAISTPLASIFGSGFLVIIPILVSTVGSYAVYAMLLIILIAYSVGSIIRFNIKHFEPLLTTNISKMTFTFERASDIALIIAYVVSVSLYLNIMSAFILSASEEISETNKNILTTFTIIVIITIGFTKGLKSLEILEKYALEITLFVVSLLIITFTIYDFNIYASTQNFIMPIANKHSSWEIITILAGMLIVVQGFETSRYLGASHSPKLRIQTSKYSQIISSVIYILFIVLAIPAVHLLNGVYDDNSLVILVGLTSSFLVVPLIIMAALSQFSAAVADTLAATGNIQEITKHKISINKSYLLIGISAIAITWSIQTLEILTLASRTFALYYLFQTIVAISICTNKLKLFAMWVLAFVLSFITIFAIPA